MFQVFPRHLVEGLWVLLAPEDGKMRHRVDLFGPLWVALAVYGNGCNSHPGTVQGHPDRAQVREYLLSATYLSEFTQGFLKQSTCRIGDIVGGLHQR